MNINFYLVSSIASLLVWVIWGEKIFRFIVRHKKKRNKCQEKILDQLIVSMYDKTIKVMLRWLLIIMLIIFFNQVPFEVIINAFKSKGLNSESAFDYLNVNTIYGIPFYTVLTSMIINSIKFDMVKKSVNCLSNYECNRTN